IPVSSRSSLGRQWLRFATSARYSSRSLSSRKSAEVFSAVDSGQWIVNRAFTVHCSLFTVHCTKHLASQPAENEFQIFHQNVAQPDFEGLGSRRETGLHKQARERFGEPPGERLNLFRLDFLGLGVGNPGLQLRACPPHGQRRENRRPAKQHRQPARRQHYLLDVGALQGGLKIARSSDTVVWHHNLFTFAYCRIAQSKAPRFRSQSFALRNPAWELRLKPAPGLRRLQIAVGDLSIARIQEAPAIFDRRNPAGRTPFGPIPADTLCPRDLPPAG